MNPTTDFLMQLAIIGGIVATGNYTALPAAIVRLGELGAVLMPPIDATALDPGDRAAEDAKADAEVTKP